MIFKLFGFLMIAIPISVTADKIKPNQDEFLMDKALFFIGKDTGLWQVIFNGECKSANDCPISIERKSPKAEEAISVDYDYSKNLLFWSTWTGEIYSCPLRKRFVKEEEVKLIYSSKEWTPAALGVDLTNELLYIIDSNANSLYVMTYDGKYGMSLLRSFSPVLSRNYKPHNIEIDPYGGYMFVISSENPDNRIYRLEMDASGYRLIDPDSFTPLNEIGGVTIDRYGKRVLVAVPKGKSIISLDFNGTSESEIFKPKFNYVSSMSLTSDFLYMVDLKESKSLWDSQLNLRIDLKSSSLNRCKFMNNKCVEPPFEILKRDIVDSITQIKAVDPGLPRLLPKKWRNPCSNREGNNCEQICINKLNMHNTDKQYTCRCKTGYRLAENGRNCEKLDEYLIYENDNFVAGIDFEASEPGFMFPQYETFKPFEIPLKHRAGDLYGFDFDSMRKNFYFTDVNSILTRNLDKQKTWAILSNPLKNFGLLALEDNANILYYVEVDRNRTNNRQIYSICVTAIPEEPLFGGPVVKRTATKVLQSDVGKVLSLIVHAPYVFYTAYNKKIQKFEVIRMYLDGSNREVMDSLGAVSMLAMDHKDEKLYYIDEKLAIRRVNLDCISNMEKVVNLWDENSAPACFINGFTVYDQWIYIKDRNEIRRIKKNGKDPKWMTFDPYPFNYDMKTPLLTKSLKMVPEGPCREWTSCQHFCFNMPDMHNQTKLIPMCACDDAFTLEENKKSCTR